MPENTEHQVTLSPSYKTEMWRWLNERYRADLIALLRQQPADAPYPGAERLQELIRMKLARDGIADAADLYQLVVGTTAEEFWCEVRNEL